MINFYILSLIKGSYCGLCFLVPSSVEVKNKPNFQPTPRIQADSKEQVCFPRVLGGDQLQSPSWAVAQAEVPGGGGVGVLKGGQTSSSKGSGSPSEVPLVPSIAEHLGAACSGLCLSNACLWPILASHSL